jgi:hypothetical protein
VAQLAAVGVAAATPGKRGVERDITSAEVGGSAIRYAVEELPSLRSLGAWMEVGDERFNGDEIQRLDEASDYPLRKPE